MSPIPSLFAFFHLDVLVYVNAMHAVFVVGVASLFYHSRRLHYWWMQVVGHAFVTAAAWASLADLLIGPFAYGCPGWLPALFVTVAHVSLATTCLNQALRIRNVISPPDHESERDLAVASALQTAPPQLLALARQARLAVGLQSAWYVVEILATPLVARIVGPASAMALASAASSPWAFELALRALVEGYNGAIHKAIVLSQGCHAVTALRPALLQVFSFANGLFTAYYAVQLAATVHAAVATPSRCDRVLALNACALGLRVVINAVATWRCVALRAAVICRFTQASVPHTVVGPGTDVVRGRSLLTMARALASAKLHRPAWRTALAGLAATLLFGLWQGECIAIVLAGARAGAAPQGLALALNFAIHAVALYHLQFFKIAESQSVFANRRRLHYCLAGLLALVSISQATSMLISWPTRSELWFRFATAFVALRGALAAGLGLAFFFLDLSPASDQPAREREALVALLDYSSSDSDAPPGPDPLSALAIALPAANTPTTYTEDEGQAMLDAAPVPAAAVVRRRGVGLALLYALLALFCVVAFINAALATPCDFGAAEAHAGGYGVIFHFAFLVSGFGYRGVRYFNTTNLVVVGLNSGSFAAINAALAVLAHPPLAVAALAAASAFVGAAASGYGWSLRAWVLRHSLPDISPIW